MTAWMPVVDYETNYLVSDDGQVESLPRATTRGGLLKQHIGKQGYPEVSLWKDGKSRTRKVHRLVAAAFLGPRPAGLEIRHLNGDPLDSRATNLRYGTRRENAQDTVDHQRNRNAAKTHCPQQHEYTPENTYRRPAAPRTRYCRACNSARPTRSRAGG